MTKKSRDRRKRIRINNTLERFKKENPKYAAFNALPIDEIKSRFRYYLAPDECYDGAELDKFRLDEYGQWPQITGSKGL